jgi:membrane protein
LLRVVVLAGRDFHDDKCQLRASALTYYSLLSLVPVVAMAFGLAQGFGLESHLDKWLGDALNEHRQVYEYIMDFSKKLLANTRGGLIAGMGVAILFYTVINVLGQIERSFNDIWNIKRSRNLPRRLADYMMVMLVAPVLFIMSSSVNVLASGQVRKLLAQNETLGQYFGPMVNIALAALPWVTVWLLFTFFYVFMPNTKVRLSSAALAGVVAGSVYQVVQWGYIAFQVHVATRYGAIYGSFAALPLFLIWMQMSWLVLLFGAEISFAWQNVDTYEFEPDCLSVSRRFKRQTALLITHLLVKAFDREEPPLTAEGICHTLELPIRLVNDIIYELVSSGIVSETRSGRGEETAYQVARPLERFTIRYVMDAVDGFGTEDIPLAELPEMDRIRDKLSAMAKAADASGANVALKDV